MTSAVPKLGESLADLFPDVAAQWHPTKNGDVLPKHVVAGSGKKFWWKCPVADDHEWDAVVASRTGGGRGCACCRGLKVSVTNSLASRFPDVAAQWHPTKNGDLLPDQVVAGSHTKFWWKCPVADDHEWDATPRARTRGDGKSTGCPCCRGFKVSVTNSLASRFPDVAAQWHPTKNRDVLPDQVVAGSHTKFWWKCPVADDHEWDAQANSRTWGGRGCACCHGLKVSVTNNLAALFPDVAAQWHPTKNGDVLPKHVVAGSGKKFWWKCPVADDHEWDATSNDRTGGGAGCACCRGLKVSVTNNLAALFPDVAAQWHPTKNGDVLPDQVVAGSNKKFWWKCPVVDDHEWDAIVANRTKFGHGCSGCTLTPRSAQEMRLAYELSALVDFDLDVHKVRFGGRLRDVDIVLEDLKVVVEFDGAYWHRNRVDKDREKTQLIEDADWRVIRVRERPLDSIHLNDVMVNTLAPAKAVADAVLAKIVEVTGVEIPRLDEYLASEEPWREAEALTAIRVYLEEREAKKRERKAARLISRL